tara:strand:+ start:246 stop:506 length:261 start_codon:yes stop_codon:yes gene_type:complete
MLSWDLLSSLMVEYLDSPFKGEESLNPSTRRERDKQSTTKYSGPPIRHCANWTTDTNSLTSQPIGFNIGNEPGKLNESVITGSLSE